MVKIAVRVKVSDMYNPEAYSVTTNQHWEWCAVKLHNQVEPCVNRKLRHKSKASPLTFNKSITAHKDFSLKHRGKYTMHRMLWVLWKIDLHSTYTGESYKLSRIAHYYCTDITYDLSRMCVNSLQHTDLHTHCSNSVSFFLSLLSQHRHCSCLKPLLTRGWMTLFSK